MRTSFPFAEAPPALPALVQPRAAHRTEHVSSEDPRADIFDSARGEILVGSRLALRVPEHLLKGSRWVEPFMQCRSPLAQGIGGVLIGARPEAVQGDGKAIHANFCHSAFLSDPGAGLACASASATALCFNVRAPTIGRQERAALLGAAS
jgi:hypothetical protein